MSNNGESHSDIDVLCTNIQNPERIVRQNGLKQLLEICQLQKSDENEVASLFDKTYLYILKCYSDKYEICRSLSCCIINEMLDKLPDNDYYLECIIPVITRRVGQKEIIEESEEIRFELLQQLNLLIEKFKAKRKKDDRLFKSYNDIIDILLRSLKDTFPSILKECCSIIITLSDEKCFHYRAETLVTPLISLLHHRHSTIRITSIKALGYTSLHIFTNGECIQRIITEISPLLMDDMAHVRRECGQVGCLMLLQLRDRYSFFDRILPLVFCCLTDENEEVRTIIAKKWITCGEQYFEENEKELSPKTLVDNLPKNYPKSVIRPTLGCRAIMQRSLRMIDIVLNEMEDWKESVRLHSLKLLGQIVLHCEKTLTVKFMEIYPVLSDACMDSVQFVTVEAINVSKMIGHLLEYKDWSPHAIQSFKKLPDLGKLTCLTAIYSTSDDDEKLKDLTWIVKLISDSSLCISTKVNIQNQLLELSEIFVDHFFKKEKSSKKEEDIIEENLYKIIMHVTSISISDDTSVCDKGKLILLKLASNELKILHGKYLKILIDSIEGLDCSNSEGSEPILILYGYLELCGFQKQYLDSAKQAINTVLSNAKPDGKVKILTAISIAMLNWKTTMDIPLDESIKLLTDFIDEIIVPCLIWKAGRSAESIRSMASSVLCSISQNSIEEAIEIFPNLSTNFTALVEDNNVATRAYALRSLINIGPVDVEKIKPLGYAILTRLDDPSGEVREKAAKCLGILQPKINEENVNDNDAWKILLKHIFTVMTLHLDDPDIKLTEAIIDSLRELGKRNTNMFREHLESTDFHTKLNEIKQVLFEN